MADASPAARYAFATDHRSAAAAAFLAVSRQCTRSQDRFWTHHWIPFTDTLGLDPFLSTVDDKVPILCILAHWIRDGRASRSGHPVCAERVCDEILAIAKVFTSVGLPDPWFTTLGHMDPRLTALYASYKNADPAPNHVKPLPIQVLHRAQAIALPRPLGQATIDMAWLAFFFLLRPGEYCAAPDNHPLCCADVTLLIGATRLDLLTASPTDLRRATHVSLTFDDQKNRKRGEIIAHGRSGHTVACPVLTIIRRILCLRAQHLPATSPLCTYVDSRPTPLTTNHITNLLRAAARSLLTLGFAPTDVNAAASTPVAPWPSSAAASTPTPSGWWAAGAPTPCFATCTPKPFPSSGTSAELCSPMAPTPFSRALTSRSPLHSSSRRLRHHSTAKYPPTHPPMAGMAQEQGGGGGGADYQ